MPLSTAILATLESMSPGSPSAPASRVAGVGAPPVGVRTGMAAASLRLPLGVATLVMFAAENISVICGSEGGLAGASICADGALPVGVRTGMAAASPRLPLGVATLVTFAAENISVIRGSEGGLDGASICADGAAPGAPPAWALKPESDAECMIVAGGS